MKKLLSLASVLALIGYGHLASADEAATMDMPGMPGMKMSATPVEATPTAPNAIYINNFAFGPKVLTVAVGATVTWTNKDDEPHTVVNAGSPPAFKSQALDGGDSFSFTFTQPGTYQYFCSIHPFMTGTVAVK